MFNKISGVPNEAVSIVFNDYSVSEGTDYHYQTTMINTEGWAKGECQYNVELTADGFNGWIFVFNCDSLGEDLEHSDARSGAWFRLDDFRRYDAYYGTYSELKDSDDPIILGDIDGDGMTTSNDALEILRMSIDNNYAKDDVKTIADVDGDGTVTANDTLEVLRNSVGITQNGSLINKLIAA